MRIIRNLSFAMGLAAALAFGQQLTVQQRVDDFQYVASVVNRNAAALDLKKQNLGFDALNLAPWLDRIRKTNDDFEYYDILVDYTSSFQDYYTYTLLPSDFEASLGFTADIYDGKAIVESIDRGLLPSARFAIALGDEVVSVDGKPTTDLLAQFSKYFVDSNPSATKRSAADLLSYRPQTFMPRAAQIGQSAVVVLRKADGSTVTLTIPWQTYGTPMRVGPVTDFLTMRSKGKEKSPERLSEPALDGEPSETGQPLFERLMTELDRSGRERVPHRQASTLDPGALVETALPAIESIGALEPVFALPSNFAIRRGTSFSDWFYSGSYTSGGKRIGFIRISDYSTSSSFTTQLDTEIAWMQTNTDVLVIDQMRDRLSSLCGAEAAAARFIGKAYTQPGFELRSTWANVQSFQDSLDSAIDFGASTAQINLLQNLVSELRDNYYNKGGARTAPFPFCGSSLDRDPVRSSNGTIVNYTKPILLVTDELSSDFFAATVKDNRDGVIQQFGMQTSGRLGTSVGVGAGAYSETQIYVKDGILRRPKTASRPGFPDSPYIENAGVYPEIVNDYMTLDNFRTQGAAFVDAFTQAALALVQ